MLGMEYICQQFYSYQDVQQLKEIIKIDQIGIINIYEDEQIIKYQIDRSKCLRLSDLIYMINQNFVRLYLGQLLTLFVNLLNKVISLQTQYNIYHQYLDPNRIWLIFQNSFRSVGFVYTKIDYKIAFTGYQCQQYVIGSNLPISAYEKIQQIIKAILKQFQKNNMFFKNSTQNEIKQQIYDPIIQVCDKLDIFATLDKIQGILKEFGFDEQQQTIKFEDSLKNQKVEIIRNQNIKQIEQQIKEYVQVLKDEENPLILEMIILTQMKNIASTIENQQKLKKVEKDNHYLKSMESFYEEYQIQLKNSTENIIQVIVKDTLQQKLIQYKLEYLEEEIQKLTQNIVKKIVNMRLNQYFYNSPHYYIRYDQQHLLQCQLSLYSKLLLEIVNEEIDIFILLQVILVIDEFI
ncbi:unnamed protein product [Paramecium pentaurelia]|uniref:Uncharacterized protein n=1 Tax=Paramecium pentaurelia TaxID=43138 RepID=A0A8S1WFI4_9CILI|nr:unnamed protein product [Paramecium pentaurelia]